mgnify:CR=1 FL=1
MRKTEGSPLPFGAAAKERKVNFSVQVPMEKRVNFCFTEKETQSRKSALTCRRKKA